MSRLRAVLAAVAAASLHACGGSDGGSEPPPPAVALRVTPGTASLRMGETVQLAAGAVTADGATGALPAGTAVAWTSEDTTIAVVNATGQARAVRAGTVALRATAGALTGATTATVRAATPQLATAARATARIGPAGGTVTTTGGGRRYVLTIPAGALRDSTDVSITPLAGMADLPAGAGLVAGADFAPAGLRFAVPALLRVEGVTGIDARRVRGFAYGRADGADFQRGAATLRGDTLVVPVTHFSGGGAVTTPDLAELALAGPFPPFAQNDAGMTAYIALEDLARANRESGMFDVAALAELARRWYTDVVRPALTGAGNDAALVEALGLYGSWRYVLECGASACGGEGGTGNLHLWTNEVGFALQAELAGTIDEARTALVAALTAGIARSNARCLADHDLVAAKNAGYYQTIAERYSVATGGLAADVVIEGLCVKVVFETVSFPDTLTPGTAAPLRITAGLSFGGAAPVHSPRLLVYVSATGATDDVGVAFTSAGTVELPFTPSGAGPVRLAIRASETETGLAAFGVWRDTVVERALAIAVALTSTAAILDPGATATFTAAVTGTTTTGVTWTVTGGTFTTAGNTLTYLAGSTPGTYAVTARSVADPTKTATAPVTIVGPSDGATVAVMALRGESIATVGGSSITCTIQDTVATAAGIPAAEETRADCTGAVGGAALATGSYVLGGGASAALTLSGAARTSASASAIDGQVSTVTRLRIRFTVGPDGVRVDLTGRLEAAIPDTASNTDASALLLLSGPGSTTVLRQEVGSSVVGGWAPPISLAESRRLGPGTYELTVIVGNDARNSTLSPPAGGTAAATFTLTFSR